MAFSGNMIWIICIFVPLVHPVWSQYSKLNSLKFQHYSTMVTWQEAQYACRKNHTDLVTIRNEKQRQNVSRGQGWIGLYRENNAGPWKWSRGDDKATFFFWRLDEPIQDKHCAVQWPNTAGPHFWAPDGCDTKHTYMCYDETLVLVKENKTWEEALQHCRTLTEVNSYDLVTLITPDDYDYARERAQHATTDEVWTGLRYLADEWFWMLGEEVQYQDIPSCPAVRCGVLEKNSNSLFGIRDCSQRKNFFCYNKPKPT